MNARERMLAAINHEEPDRIPLDIGAGKACGIHVKAYKNLLEYLGLEEDVQLFHFTAQLAYISEQVYRKLGIDARPVGLKPIKLSPDRDQVQREGEYFVYQDEWNRTWKAPVDDGLYYDLVSFPLAETELDQYQWPDPTDPERFVGLVEDISLYKDGDYLLVFNKPAGNGFLQMGAQLYGFDRWFLMLGLEPGRVDAFLDQYLDFKIRYWEALLARIGDEIDVVCEADDIGTQKAPWMSLNMYRKFIKPRQETLFKFIKNKADVKIFLHSCGSVYDYIPDLIEAGVDILNPIQVSAAKMDTARLKREFGQKITFWGGGIDTQRVLPYGSKQEIDEEVKRRIANLGPGGGFVFAPVHNIQADVPPENIVTMLEALQKHGSY